MAYPHRSNGTIAQTKLKRLVKGKVDLILMDLSDLCSVRKAVKQLRSRDDEVDTFLNHADYCLHHKTKQWIVLICR